MKAIKTTGTINEKGQLTLDSSLTIEKSRRVEVIVLIPEAEEDYQTKEEILNDFRISWQEAMNGETIPVEQIWED
jgi:hypothetical protein